MDITKYMSMLLFELCCAHFRQVNIHKEVVYDFLSTVLILAIVVFEPQHFLKLSSFILDCRVAWLPATTSPETGCLLIVWMACPG